MTTPVTQDDIVAGAVAFLSAKPDVLAMFGSDADGPWVFQYNLWTMVERSESTACVVDSEGGWAGPNLHNTLRFPRLLVSIYADPKRDANNNVTDPGEVQRRVHAAYVAVDKYLHRVDSQSQMWGTVRTVSCARLTEPNIVRLPDGDGVLRLQAYYAVTQG